MTAPWRYMLQVSGLLRHMTAPWCVIYCKMMVQILVYLVIMCYMRYESCLSWFI